MGITELLRLAESDAINNGGVVEGVREDRVFWSKHGLEETSVRVETWPVQDRILAIVEFGKTVF